MDFNILQSFRNESSKFQESTEAQLPKLKVLNKFLEFIPGYIAGGCFKNIFFDEPIKDVDIFFKNTTDAEIANSLCDTSPNYEELWQTSQTITYKYKPSGDTVQLITSFFGNPDEVVSNFDFTITKAYYIYNSSSNTFQFFHHYRFFASIYQFHSQCIYPSIDVTKDFQQKC